ncbi:MAG TPA: hypothetical protein VGI60_16015 [Chthoniobacterales bacterium]|jgi:hypothetical protein
MTNRWEQLLDDAERLLPSYLERVGNLGHAHKGIRRSELFFFYTLAAALAPRRIIESGRARAQSTLVLSRLFPQIPIVSLESDPESPDVALAAERLRECENVDCRFGDSIDLLPRMVEAGDVVLIDGPKDFRALKLAFRLLRDELPAAVFVHDLWLGSSSRCFLERELRSALLSDDPRWVVHYAMLDSPRALPAIVASGARYAYGATLACFERESENYGRVLRRCRAAQGRDRLRENVCKLLRRPPLTRPEDFSEIATSP